jgi:hypothetical protein
VRRKIVGEPFLGAMLTEREGRVVIHFLSHMC